MSLYVYSNRVMQSHGNGGSMCISFMLKTFCFWPNPTWCMLRCGLKMIYGDFQTAASDFYFWKKWKPWQPTSIGITWHIQPFSMQSACSVSYCFFFFCSCASSQFSSQGTVNSMRSTVFCESDHPTMSGRFSVWIMWTGNCRDVLRSAETFQSLALFSSFILGFLFPHRTFTFLEKLNYGFLGCNQLLVCCLTLCS